MTEHKEFKSFYKTVSGNEGSKCHYTTRLDTYGCGCQHNCSYCYARSLLGFRGLWDSDSPAVADINKIEAKVKKVPRGTIFRLGGMTDCFQLNDTPFLTSHSSTTYCACNLFIFDKGDCYPLFSKTIQV